ncbi:MAG: hypothetical protein COV44_00555 [Deltaproteobacteria bacterium CG11_big_fil_rev_8_21_14_0_20_45_16]|nr:MAG: hypothetical protein COV44_00555 [Deltaproteobacteria bacterium CG11_big_fil_rev_8_21_14_0_20_45_16]
MSRIYILAKNTFNEARHNKVLHLAGGFAAVLIVFSLFMGEVSLYQNIKVVKDIGMATISLFGVFVAIYMGVNLLYKELELRTIYTIVSKPVDRFEIILGKYLGIVLVLTVNLVLMTAFLYLTCFVIEFRFDLELIPALVLILFELFIVAVFAVFFSSFSSPFLSGLFTTGVFMVGRVSNELGLFGERSRNELFKIFATSVQKIFDLEAFNLRTEVVHQLPVYASDVYYPILYSTFLVAIFLTFSIVIFAKRDFK